MSYGGAERPSPAPRCIEPECGDRRGVRAVPVVAIEGEEQTVLALCAAHASDGDWCRRWRLLTTDQGATPDAR
jgi:hypothetical protein